MMRTASAAHIRRPYVNINISPIQLLLCIITHTVLGSLKRVRCEKKKNRLPHTTVAVHDAHCVPYYPVRKLFTCVRAGEQTGPSRHRNRARGQKDFQKKNCPPPIGRFLCFFFF